MATIEPGYRVPSLGPAFVVIRRMAGGLRHEARFEVHLQRCKWRAKREVWLASGCMRLIGGSLRRASRWLTKLESSQSFCLPPAFLWESGIRYDYPYFEVEKPESQRRCGAKLDELCCGLSRLS